MVRLRVVAAVATAACTIAATAVAALSAVSLTVAPSVVHEGRLVVISGSAGDCPAGDTATITSRAFVRKHEFAGVPAAVAKVRSDGRFQTKARIRRRLRARLFVVTARCGGGNLGISAHITVLH